MKHLKRMLGAFLVVLVTLISTKSIFATEQSYTITINGAIDGHTYEAYQIFKGDLSGDTLSNIEWGNGVSDAGKKALGDAVTKAESLKETADAEAFAGAVAPYLQNPIAASGNTITAPVAGYYLIKDRDGSLSATDKSYTSYILEVVKNVTVTPKADVPTVQKKVKDTNDTTGETSNWQDSADHDINDNIPFQLTATLPSNYSSYNTYYLEFADTMSKGLTFDQASVKVTVDNVAVDASKYAITTSTEGFSLKFTDLKTAVSAAKAGSKVVVEYNATLNKNAIIGSLGNPNDVKLIFSNDPNYTGDGSNTPTGETPKDRVIVFTYQVIVDKVDEKKAPLSGAEFKLYKKLQDGSEKEVALDTNQSTETHFAFKGLDDGDYILKETKTESSKMKLAS
ncbi:isopeptide-forming domain-containing fimbrial protein [Streptococcus ovuberis]|uniref:Isopeptide-forming domain-containing fimbrial protein n=1 Tax=Streptococcus ovuberis TaxID=1936207 RepID=A0A7X6S1M7_9STRE|nr:isopeptide-forming domain-containing fimbrial protein [Streptococcus ovuberis]NKZ21334.1 isopeptide-forming domain-containing fimbrial protein [Streptococcus ovuberis]